MRRPRWVRAWVGALAFAGVAAGIPRDGLAEVHREGDWPPADQELVSFSARNLARGEAIRRLASRVGWSVVVDLPSSSGPVDVDVTRQPAAKVLELILGQADFVAHREGALISIHPGTSVSRPPIADSPGVIPPPPASAAKVTSSPSHAPAAVGSVSGMVGGRRKHGKDRVVTASSLVVGREDVLGDLVVVAGGAEVFGRVTGDAMVIGGSLRVRKGGVIEGDISIVGGSVELDEGARVDGEVSTVGGSEHRDAKAIVGRSAGVDLASTEDATAGGTPDSDSETADTTIAESGNALADGNAQVTGRRGPSWASLMSGAGRAVTRTALLFAFGVVLWALVSRRTRSLKEEVATRPVQAFALGAVAVVAGVVLLVALCVTIVGIPIAVVTLFVAIFGAYAGVCAALTAAGAALLRHRTASPYLHLAAGCGIYLLLSSIPFVGKLVTGAVILIGLGALIGTRAAGLVRVGHSQERT